MPKCLVASFTDAWIETGLMRTELLGGTSHLLQMRGLKLVQQWRAFGVYVASFTDAWIETPTTAKPVAREVVASFTDAWIETTLQRRV